MQIDHYNRAMMALIDSEAVMEIEDNVINVTWPAIDGDIWTEPVRHSIPHGDTKFKRMVSETIRELVTLQFHRVTGTAHHLGQLEMSETGRGLGITNTIKKAYQPFKIIFQSSFYADCFMSLYNNFP